MTHDDDIPENPDERVYDDETGDPGIDFVITDSVPEQQPDEDYDDDVEGMADGQPIPSVYGSERQEGVS